MPLVMAYAMGTEPAKYVIVYAIVSAIKWSYSPFYRPYGMC
jgi:hypothetical protein